MTTTDDLTCGVELRRDFIRRAGQNGLDHVEVSDDHRTLTVSFLAKAPAWAPATSRSPAVSR